MFLGEVNLLSLGKYTKTILLCFPVKLTMSDISSLYNLGKKKKGFLISFLMDRL